MADDMKLHQKSDAERVVPMPGKTVPADQRGSQILLLSMEATRHIRRHFSISKVAVWCSCFLLDYVNVNENWL